jgi:hypothetical protein
MSPRRTARVVAILAALAMAPSSVFAAAPNELLSAAITPPAGTTSTLFELSVRYRSPAGNAADSVTAAVAGKTVTLHLTSGSAVDGTWTGSTALPVGSWMVTLQAYASKGVDPTATIGPIGVGLGVPQPSSSPVNSQPSTDAPESGGASATAEPQRQRSAAPISSGSATRAGGTARPSGGAAAAASETAASSPASHRQATHGRSRGPRSSSSPDGGAAAVQPSARAGTAEGHAVGRELVGMVLLFGIGGVAAIALLGAAWIIIAARRDRAEPSTVAIPTFDPATPAMIGLPTAERRRLRLARLRPSDDPILAALGLRDEQQPPEEEGPGEGGGRLRRDRRPARK